MGDTIMDVSMALNVLEVLPFAISSSSCLSKSPLTPPESNKNGGNSTTKWLQHKQTHRLSADSSLRDLIETIKSRASTSTSKSKSITDTSPERTPIIGEDILLLDISTHPPKPLPYNSTNNQSLGSASVTLHALGWFPGGSLVLCLAEELEDCRLAFLSNLGNLEKHEGHAGIVGSTESGLSGGNKKVVVVGSQGVEQKPSEVFASVRARFDHDDELNSADQQSNKNAACKALSVKQSIQRTEQERRKRLDQLIATLETKSKSKSSQKTSAQVRRMLIKRRAEGPTSLKEMDKFYLEVVFLVDFGHENKDDDIQDDACQEREEEGFTKYCFFSQLATVGRVASDVSQVKTNLPLYSSFIPEFLVSVPLDRDNEEKGHVYRRVPNTWSLYDAAHNIKSKGYTGKYCLQPFEKVVVRLYHPSKGEATPTLLENQEEEKEGKSKDVQDVTMDEGETSTSDQPKDEAEHQEQAPMVMDPDTTNINIQKERERLHQIFQAIQQAKDASSSKTTATAGSKKKKSSTSTKVQQMLLQRAATKNSRNTVSLKKVPMSNRVYLKAILVHKKKDNQGWKCEEEGLVYVFDKRNHSLDHVLQTVLPLKMSKKEKESVGLEWLREERKDGREEVELVSFLDKRIKNASASASGVDGSMTLEQAMMGPWKLQSFETMVVCIYPVEEK